MSPLQRIAAWLKTLPEAVQMDIGFMVVTAMTETGVNALARDSEPASLVAAAMAWLRPLGGPHRTVAKAAAFRAVFDLHFAGRGEAGWTDAEDFHHAIVGEARQDPQDLATGFADQLAELLAKIPERKAQWAAAGASWRELADTYLSDAALRQWWSDALAARRAH